MQIEQVDISRLKLNPKNPRIMNVKDLNHNPNNPRKITNRKLKMLKAEMEEYGDLSGIILNIRTDRLVGGHQRTRNFDPEWEVKKKPHKDKTGTIAQGVIVTPYGEWSYREVDWPEEKEYAANIAANKQLAEYNMPVLKDILQELDTGDFDMALTGFDNNELEMLMSQYHVENKYTNENCEYPIIPRFDEKYNAIVVICETETEIANLKSKLGVPIKAQSYKNSFLGNTQIIKYKDISFE